MTTNQSKDEGLFERRVMDCLLIARSCTGEGRNDMQELLPAHRDLMALISQKIIEARLEALIEVKEEFCGEYHHLNIDEDDGYEILTNSIAKLEATLTQGIKEEES